MSNKSSFEMLVAAFVEAKQQTLKFYDKDKPISQEQMDESVLIVRLMNGYLKGGFPEVSFPMAHADFMGADGFKDLSWKRQDLIDYHKEHCPENNYREPIKL